MRAVTGRVAPSKPVSLSKASAILSRFAAESVARRDVAAYLRRASAALDDLVGLHRELRAQPRRPDANAEGEEEKEKKRGGSQAEVEQLGDGEVVGGEQAEDGQRKRKKKKEEEEGKKRGRKGDEAVMEVDERSEQSKKKKKRRKLEAEA